MRSALRLLLILIAFGAGSPAAVADTWTGVYLGGTIGRRTIDAKWETTCLSDGFPGLSCPDGGFPERLANDNPARLGARDARFGVYSGAQLQLQNFVLGIEGDWGHSRSKMTQGGIPGAEDPGAPGRFGPDQVTVTAEWDASVRGRLGFLLHPATMLYGTGGLAWMKLEASAFCGLEFNSGGWCSPENIGLTDRTSEIVKGFTWGFGMESMLTSGVLLRVEYRRAEYGDLRYKFLAERLNNLDAVTAKIETETNTVSVGLAYKY